MSRGICETKRIQEAAREAELLRAVAARKKSLTAVRRANRRRRKTVPELMAMLSAGEMQSHILRPAEAYVSRSHNFDRQVSALIRHLFVRYPVPEFMLQACLRETPVGPTRSMREIIEWRKEYRRWFLALAQSGGFTRMVKGILTSREAHAFLHAPSDGTIHANLWWAKMQVAGVPESLIGSLNDRIFADCRRDYDNERLADVVRFYARYAGEMDRASFDEVTDFIAYQLRRDSRFSAKGRTAASMIHLSNAWHREMQYAKLGQHIQWRGFRAGDWFYEAATEIWEMSELNTNKALCAEGRKQKHCVYSYVQRCVDGRSAIFSLRAYRKFAAYDADGNPAWDRSLEMCRVTVEVNEARYIVQARGPLNRTPTRDERQILRRWASATGITLPETWRGED